MVILCEKLRTWLELINSERLRCEHQAPYLRTRTRHAAISCAPNSPTAPRVPVRQRTRVPSLGGIWCVASVRSNLKHLLVSLPNVKKNLALHLGAHLGASPRTRRKPDNPSLANECIFPVPRHVDTCHIRSEFWAPPEQRKCPAERVRHMMGRRCAHRADGAHEAHGPPLLELQTSEECVLSKKRAATS